MRFAFISDIHGNLHALKLVRTDLQHQPVDQIVCLGDVASLGPQPREVLSRPRQLHVPLIMGNHDNYLLHSSLTENHHPWLRAAELWCLPQLSSDDLNYLYSFKPQLRFKPDSHTTLLCFHGSPRSNEEFLYPNTSSETLDENFPARMAKFWLAVIPRANGSAAQRDVIPQPRKCWHANGVTDARTRPTHLSLGGICNIRRGWGQAYNQSASPSN